MAFHEGDCTVTTEKAHIKLAKFLLDFITGNHVDSVAINAAGTGYTVDDVLSVAGGTVKSSMVAQAIVTTVGGSGEVTGVRLKNWGAYSANPSTTGNAVTGGTGSGCTLDLTIESATWTQDRSTYVDDNTEFEWIAHGVNLSGANPYGGIFTRTGSGIPQWVPKYMTSFNSGLAFHQQPGASPPTDLITSDGPRVPLVDTPMHYFFFCSGRRFIAIARNAPTYEWCHIGLFFPFVIDPATDYPLPIICSGTTMRDSENMASGIGDLHCALPSHFNNGQMHLLRWIDGTSKRFQSTNVATTVYLYPTYVRTTNTEMFAPNVNGGTLNPTVNVSDITDFAFSTMQSGLLAPLPIGVNNRTFLIWPLTICRDDAGASDVIGELDGVFHIQGRGISAEDRVIFNGERFVVFPNVNSNDLQRFYCIREG